MISNESLLRTRNFVYEEIASELDRFSEKSDIKIWILKGPALALRYYSSETRSYTDLDVFIEDRNFQRVDLYLTSIGFNKIENELWEANNFKSIYDRNGFTIELHHNFLFNRDFDIEIIQNSRNLKSNKYKKLLELGAEDLLAYLIGHHVYQHLLDQPKWLKDIELVWLSEKDNFNLDYFERRIEKWNLKTSLSLINEIFKTKHIPEIDVKVKNIYLWKAKFIHNFVNDSSIKRSSHRKSYLNYLILKGITRDRFSELFVYLKHKLEFHI